MSSPTNPIVPIWVGIVAVLVALLLAGGWVRSEHVPTDLDAAHAAAGAASGMCALVLASGLGLGVGLFRQRARHRHRWRESSLWRRP